MPRTVASRRLFLRSLAVGGAGLISGGLLDACGGTAATSSTSSSSSSPLTSAAGTATAQPTISTARSAATIPSTSTATAASTANTTAPTASLNAGTPTKPSTLRVASFYDIKHSGWDGLVKSYNQDHPYVTINPEVKGGSAYNDTIFAQAAGGTPPDVIGAENSTMFFQFVGKGILEDLSPDMARTNQFTATDFFPKLLQRYTVAGKVYGIPYDNQPVCCMFYTGHALQDAGVSPPPKDWTWNDALQAAQKLTKTSGGNVTQFGMTVGWTSLLYAFGGSLVDSVQQPTKCTLDDPKSMQAIQFYMDLMYKYHVSPTPADSKTMKNINLFSNTLAMTLAGYWITVFDPTHYHAIDTKVQIGPKGPEGTQAYSTGGTAYCIATGAKQKAIAWDFITYFMGEVGHKAEYAAAKAPGASYPPAHIPSFQWWAKQPNYLGSGVGDITSTADNGVVFAPASLNWPKVDSDVVEPGMSRIFAQQQPVSSLTEIAAKATAMLQQLNQSAS